MSSLPTAMPTIELTPDETRLVHLLTECANWVDQNPSRVDALRLKDDDGTWIGKERGDEPVELRIAGGWVRDKVRSGTKKRGEVMSLPALCVGAVRSKDRPVRLDIDGAVLFLQTAWNKVLTSFIPQLLGRQSDDIDVSTSPDPITGLKFAMLFEQYLESIGQRDLVRLGEWTCFREPRH